MQHIDELGSAGEQGSGGCAHILPPAEVYHEHVALPGEQWGGARPLRQPRGVGPPHITETLQAAQVDGLFDIPLYSSETRNVVHMSVTLSLSRPWSGSSGTPTTARRRERRRSWSSLLPTSSTGTI